MYRSASLDLPSDSVAMPPPSRPSSRAAVPVLKLSRSAENGSVFGDAQKVIIPIVSNVNADGGSAEPTNANEYEAPKRKVQGVDMRPYKKARLVESFCETVKLIVGSKYSSSYKTFVVHKDILCAASPCFEAGFKPEWKEGAERIMELPEDDPTYFAPLLYLVYSNEVIYPEHTPDMALEELARFYCLAEKYQMPRLQNDLIDAMVYETVAKGQYIYTGQLNHIFRNSRPSSKLRLFAVNCTLTNWKSFGARNWKQEDLNADLVFEILLAFDKDPRAALKETFLDFESEYCELYHIHEVEQQGNCKTLKLPEHVCADF